MKFGDTLRSRSIPEWGHYNIDYEYLKDLIKHQTTPGTNKAVSIPGQGENSERVFRETFLQVLEAQHDRINLFIRSKSGEIKARLDHINKSLEELQSKQRNAHNGTRLPARIVERYAKIDADATKTGEEIRSLSRFQVAQRTGFVKILKKYRRWTKDKQLSQDFKAQVSSRQDSLFRLDLGYLLDQYIDVLGALRAVFDGDGAPPAEYERANAQSAATRIASSLAQGDGLDFDLALSSVPLDSKGTKASYWIHADHIVEAQVLLLQQMRLYTGSTQQSSHSESLQATPNRRHSSGADTERCFGKEDEVGVVVLDHPEAFAIKENASTIGASEATKGNIGIKAAGNVRCVSSGKAAVVIRTEDDAKEASANLTISARLDVKSIKRFLTTDDRPPHGVIGKVSKQPNGEANGKCHDETMDVQQWLAKHKEISPVAGFGSKRTRFVGLHNNSAGGIWATLDRDVFMKTSLDQDLIDENWPTAARVQATLFPHAILEIRREGAQATSLLQALDKSHLFERVRGFSMEAHAVWTCCKPMSMTSPFWMPLLDQDIRKLPEPVKRKSRRARSSTAGSVSQSSPPHTSTSNTSYDGLLSPLASRNGETSATSVQEFVDPPSLQAFRKKRRTPYAEYPPPLSSANEEPEPQRYWNEYDHPEDEDTGGFYIYVDPDAHVKFPGQDIIEAWSRRTRRLFGLRDKSHDASYTSAAEDGSSDDEDTLNESPVTRIANYGTLPTQNAGSPNEGYFSSLFRSLRDPNRDVEALQERRSLLSQLEVRQHNAEMTKLRFYATCLAMAVAINFILGLMTMTSRKKERGAVDVGVLFGTICTLVLCVVALVSMKTRKEKLGWVHQGAVLSIAGAVVALDVLLLLWVVRV